VPAYERRNNNSFYINEKFAVEAVKKLIESKKVEIIDYKPHIVNPLSVAVQRNKNRLILDCSYVNKYVSVPHFKYEDWKVALNFFKNKGYIIAWDLKDGYHHVMIHPDFRDYLGFTLVLDGKSIFC
jgi:DNA topoisomerase VI subunit A